QRKVEAYPALRLRVGDGQGDRLSRRRLAAGLHGESGHSDGPGLGRLQDEDDGVIILLQVGQRRLELVHQARVLELLGDGGIELRAGDLVGRFAQGFDQLAAREGAARLERFNAGQGRGPRAGGAGGTDDEIVARGWLNVWRTVAIADDDGDAQGLADLYRTALGLSGSLERSRPESGGRRQQRDRDSADGGQRSGGGHI